MIKKFSLTVVFYIQYKVNYHEYKYILGFGYIIKFYY